VQGRRRRLSTAHGDAGRGHDAGRPADLVIQRRAVVPGSGFPRPVRWGLAEGPAHSREDAGASREGRPAWTRERIVPSWRHGQHGRALHTGSGSPVRRDASEHESGPVMTKIERLSAFGSRLSAAFGRRLSSRARDESGVALIIAMMTVLLLTALGVALMMM